MKKWASSAPEAQVLAISDANYASGFYYLGNNPPTAEEFNWLFQQITQGIIDISRGWKSGNAYSVGQVIYSTDILHSMKFFECTVAGTSGNIEPAWGAVGTTIVDGTVTWKVFDIRQGTSIGKIPALIDIGGGVAGLPAVNGSLLTGLPIPDLSGYVLGSAFTGANQSKTPNGWQILYGGVIVQWGTTASAITADGRLTVTFPIAFPNSCISAIGNPVDESTSGGLSDVASVRTGSKTATSFMAMLDGYSAATTLKINWIAIGY